MTMNFKLQIKGTQPQQKKKIVLVLTYIEPQKTHFAGL